MEIKIAYFLVVPFLDHAAPERFHFCLKRIYIIKARDTFEIELGMLKIVYTTFTMTSVLLK